MLKPNDHVLDYVDAYLHDALSSDEAGIVELHCEQCPICRVALEEARKRKEALTSLPTVEASDELIRKTELKLDRAVQRSRRWGPVDRFVSLPAAGKSFALAAAIALVIGILNIYYLSLSPSPYDLRILGQTQLLAGTDSSLRVVMFNRDTDSVVPAVPVTIELISTSPQQVIQLASFTTDGQGTGRPRFQLPEWNDGEYELRVVAHPQGGEEIISRMVNLQRSWKLMVSSDKPVYQPGQTIQVRSLALRRPDLKPVAGQDVTFSVADPKGNIIFKRNDVTSRYGIASMECPLADEILHGNYQIECKIGETSSKTTVQVKKYVLPKFRIVVDLDKPYYQPGEMVEGTVEADYFFGKSVTDGNVKIEILTTEVGRQKIQKLDVTTDQQGKAEFRFRLPETLIGREQNSGDARIFFNVTVTDSAGQEQFRQVSRIVTTQPVHVEVIPEAGELVRGVVNTVYLVTTYADGRPAATRIAVTEFDQEFVTSELGVAVVEITPQTNRINWTLRATDEQGQVGRRAVELQTGQSTDDFLLRPNKAVYDGGETMQLVALGAGNEPVFLDLIKDGQTMLTDSIEMKNGRGEYGFDLPPELFGTVELIAYRYKSHGLPVRKTRVIYIRQARELQIKAELDMQEYRPGGQAKLKLQLTDKSGKPMPGALSLAAVDEAVYSVLEQSPGMEQTFFTLEEELLEPVYAIYPWSPFFSPKVPEQERFQYEQALFSQTAHMPEEDQDFTSNGSMHETTFLVKVQRIKARKKSGLSTVWKLWTGYSVIGGILLFFYGCLLLSGRYIIAGCMTLGSLVTVAFIFFTLASQELNSAHNFADVASSLENADFDDDAKSDDGFASAGGIGVFGVEGAEILVLENSHDTFPSGGETTTEERSAPVRVREWFPETLLWRPELITDDNGQASIEIDLADSITTWRLSASAVSGEGQLGAMQKPLRVFQPFFVDLSLPVAFTRGDEVSMPVVVYNYLDKPQTVTLTLDDVQGVELLDEETKTLELAAGEVRSMHFRLRFSKVGKRQLQITARGSGVADAIKKQIDVIPDGRRVEKVYNGSLTQSAEINLVVPENAIPGSVKTIVKIYPSSFSQLVEGLDSIFQRPYGCFEQTSSTTYPNILALDYLRRTNKTVPAVEAKARQYIHLGYQRLLSFEVAGGGFDWYGDPPANRTLTAYGLMQFEDMARVHDVDPKLIERTRNWLMAQRESDGGWEPESHRLANDPTSGEAKLARLSTTAYIAWAVFDDKENKGESQPTLDFLLAHPAESIDDPYTLAVVCNALLAIDPKGSSASRYLDRLEALKNTSTDGKRTWWEQGASGRTMFYGAGRSGSIETTATAALAMLSAGRSPATVRGALTWLIEQKDGIGTWHSTQATVLALKALIEGTGQPLGGDQERRIQLALDSQQLREIVIPADQAEVMQQIDLSQRMTDGSHRLQLTDQSGLGSGYQVSFWYHVPESSTEPERGPLSIELAYDRTELLVNETISVTATVKNNMETEAPMVIVDLPVPGGFAVQVDDFSQLVQAGRIAKFQVTPRSVIVYLRGLVPGQPLTFKYQLRATMPVKLKAPPAVVYEYYDPEKRSTSRSVRLVALPVKS
jgi:uncharacterized protein YfaS (alpha-2-macroglobulin family)